MSKPMRKTFASRDALITYLREQFPQAEAISPHVPDEHWQGGRKAAEQALQAAELDHYGKTRNYLDGAVTRLSPYLRYGVLSLYEVRHYALQQGVDVNKFVNELGWRDYYQRVYGEMGDGIWHDIERYKTGFEAHEYADDLPEDVRTGTTGFSCVDAMCQELIETGYLHNHARMWLAAYVVHWRRVRWQAGARWFLSHLLDGDPASNNLSWQWVASTFSHKPYFFNRANFEKYSRGVYEHTCGLECPFEGSYAQLERELFPHKPPANQPARGKKRRRL